MGQTRRRAKLLLTTPPRKASKRLAGGLLGLYSPKHELFRCKFGELHADLARKIMANPKATASEIEGMPKTKAEDGTNPNDALIQLLSKGWVRIADSSGGVLQVSSWTSKIKNLVDQFMLQYRVYNTELDIGVPTPTKSMSYQVS